MKELLIKILDILGFAYWVEVITDTPHCTYYFGPFLSKTEAELATEGYIEDLETEGAQGIKIAIKRCKPSDLTIFDEKEEIISLKAIPSFSGQF